MAWLALGLLGIDFLAAVYLSRGHACRFIAFFLVLFLLTGILFWMILSSGAFSN